VGQHLIGIDSGGTFTDLYCADEAGEVIRVLKVPSTPDDPSRALLDALNALGFPPESLATVLHGTTIATNAIIERRGARCALVTTRGFRDVLELGRRDRPSMYGLTGVQRPLIPRDQRWEITERIDHRGNVLVPLDEAGVRQLAAHLAADGIESVVVALIHAYANPAHENRIREIFLEIRPDWNVVTATSVLCEFYEFERTSTAAVQAYLQPLVSRYAQGLTSKLAGFGFDKDILIMQSNGGLTPVGRLATRAAHIVRSGPAAGVVAAAELASEAGFRQVITGDMGGTSFDVAVVIDGKPEVTETTELDFRVPLRIPMIDVHTIGAGGGSIAWVDRGGILQVGPRSAGANPGPVCYGLGGAEPTVTDCNVVLGRINNDHPIGGAGSGRLDVAEARKAVGRLGEKLGLGVEAAAAAVLAVVNQTMSGRIRLLSVERGYDPRDFAFVAFGGAGPLHGAALMAEVGIGAMIVPPYPGVLCAMGCVIADLRYDFSQTVDTPLDQMDGDALRGMFADHIAQGKRQLAQNEAIISRIVASHHIDMCFLGQIHPLRVPVGLDWTREQIEAAFLEQYWREFGTPLENLAIVAVNLRTSVSGTRSQARKPVAEPGPARQARERGTRPVYFNRWLDTPIYRRDDLAAGMYFHGPAIVEQADTTTVIEPGMTSRVDAFGNLLVEMQ
jgi:N-methylhydantoinase A